MIPTVEKRNDNMMPIKEVGFSDHLNGNLVECLTCTGGVGVANKSKEGNLVNQTSKSFYMLMHGRVKQIKKKPNK